MLKMAAEYPEYAEAAKTTRIVETSSGDFYGKGYQDVQHRVPKIDNTIEELGWKPLVNMEDSLRAIFEAYREKVVEARTLVGSGN
jgi:nucleoside-diphosphate-sugar epimerase